MKNTYIIPEVTIFNISVPEKIIAVSGVGYSSAQGTQGNVTSGSNDANSNYMDDQATPWYK